MINIATNDENADWIKLAMPEEAAKDRAAHEKLRKKKKQPVVVKGGPGSGHRGHAGRKGEVGGSTAKGNGNSPPKLPSERRTGTVRAVQERQAERSKIMSDAYPGVKFSLVSSNPIGVKESIRLGIPGSGLPRAIFPRQRDIIPINDVDKIKSVVDVFTKHKTPSGFHTYTTIKFGSGLSFQDVFGVILHLYTENANNVTFTVDRLGNNSAVKVKTTNPIVIKKGGPGSGHKGHKGRKGLVGGGLPEGATSSGDEGLYDLQMKINIATYDKANKIQHGDVLSDVMMNAPYKTREEFASQFVDTNPVPRASKSAKPWEAEHVLYGIRETIREYGYAPSVIDGKDLERNSGLNERDLDFVYGKYMTNWVAEERTHGLYQFRIRKLQGFHFDGDNGIVSTAEALVDAMHDFGFRKPEKLYDYLMKLGKEKEIPIIVTKGGPGSGFKGHAERAGKVGGSAPLGVGGMANPEGKDTLERYMNADGTWTKERQALHTKIVDKFFFGRTPVDNPTSYVLGGGPAAGKSTLIKSQYANLPKNMVLASGDDIKLLLPEYEGANSVFVHEESAYLSKKIAAKAANEGYNVIMDGTGDNNIVSLTKKVNSMRPHGQRVVGIYVTVDVDTAIKRSAERAKAIGRYVPESVLRFNHKMVAKIFPDIISTDLFDDIDLYDTSGITAKLIAREVGKDFTILDNEAYTTFLARGGD